MKAMTNEYEVNVCASSADTSSARMYVAATALIVAGLAGATVYPIPMDAKANAAEPACSIADAEARAELKRITPSNAELLKLAKRFPAPQEWYDE